MKIDSKKTKDMAFIAMGLTNADITAIQTDYKDSVDQNHQMFLKWQEKNRPSIEDLKELFDEAHQEGIYVNPEIHDMLKKAILGNTLVL